MNARGSVAVVRTVESARELRPSWDALLSRCPARNVFLSWEWMLSWWETYGHEHELFLVSVTDDEDRLIGLAPLQIARRDYHGLSYRQLEFIGHGGEVCPEDLDFILDPDAEDAVADAIVTCLLEACEAWDVLQLSDLRAQAAAVRALQRGPAIHQQILDKSICPYLDLPATWDAYLSTLSPNWRGQVRRRRRRLESAHRVRLIRGDAATDLEAALDDLFRLHAARWERRGEPGSFGRDRRTTSFHRLLAARCRERGWLRLYLLEVDDSIVAALLGYEYAGVFSYYQAGFDPGWAEHGVGVVLMGEVIRDTIERRLVRFDFLRGPEPFKFHWTSQARRTVNVRVWGRGTRGRAHCMVTRATRHARSVLAKVTGAATR